MLHNIFLALCAHPPIYNETLTLDEIEDRLLDLRNQANALSARAESERRELNADEQAKLNGIYAQFEHYEAMHEAQKPRRRTQADPLNRTLGQPVNGAPTRGFTSQGGYLPANCSDPIDTVFGNLARGPEQFRNSAEFLGSVLQGARAGNFQNATGTEGIGVDGGFAVPSILYRELMSELMETSELWRLCRLYPVDSNNATIAMPDVLNQLQKLAGLQVDWKAENAAATGQAMKWRTVELKLHKLLAMAEASGELLEDAPGYASMVTSALGADAAMRLDHALIAGSGVATPTGYLTASSVIEVAPESGQTADTVIAENFVKLWSRLHPACKRRAVWLLSPDVMAQLPFLKFPNSTDQPVPLYMPPGGLSASPYGTILGRPVIESTLTPVPGDRGDISLVDFSQVALIMRNSARIDFSNQLNFDRDAVNWRLRWRVDAVPMWGNQKFTPRNGGLELSWAAVLGARS